VESVVVAMNVPLAVGFALILMTSAAWAQNQGHSANGQFRVSWESRPEGVVRTIEGHVYNDSPVRVTGVRLQVEGLDADRHPVGKSLAWALGDIVPGGETSFRVETMPGAVTYRISVVSYDAVSGGEAQAP